MKNKAMHIQLKISDLLFQRICAGMKEISAQQRNPFTDENRVLQLYAANPMLEPREIGELFTNRYGALHNGKQLNGDGVIRMLRLCRLANPKERTEVLTAADQAATVLLHALAGSKQAQAQLTFQAAGAAVSAPAQQSAVALACRRLYAAHEQGFFRGSTGFYHRSAHTGTAGILIHRCRTRGNCRTPRFPCPHAKAADEFTGQL